MQKDMFDRLNDQAAIMNMLLNSLSVVKYKADDRKRTKYTLIWQDRNCCILGLTTGYREKGALRLELRYYIPNGRRKLSTSTSTPWRKPIQEVDGRQLRSRVLETPSYLDLQ